MREGLQEAWCGLQEGLPQSATPLPAPVAPCHLLHAPTSVHSRWIPPSWGHLFPLVVAITSMPLTFVLSNDAYYFGVVPILAKAAAVYGITAAEIGRASIIGQPVHLLSPLVASTYLLVGMSGVEFGDHQRYTLIWSISACVANAIDQASARS